MVNFKPSLWKVIASVFVGILTIGIQFYHTIYDFNNTNFLNRDFWEIFIMRSYFDRSIVGFIFYGIITYLIWSFFQKSEAKQNKKIYAQRKNKLALVSFTLSLIAAFPIIIFILPIIPGAGFLFVLLIPWSILSPILAITGIVTSIISLIQIKRDGKTGKWMAIAALILSILITVGILSILANPPDLMPFL